MVWYGGGRQSFEFRAVSRPDCACADEHARYSVSGGYGLVYSGSLYRYNTIHTTL